jgi:hypothetical protein
VLKDDDDDGGGDEDDGDDDGGSNAFESRGDSQYINGGDWR